MAPPPRETRPVRAGGLARRRDPAALEFAVAEPPAAVVERLLARADVVERRRDVGHGDDPAHILERTPDGFTLTADPGAWLALPRTICEVVLAPVDAGARVLVRFRLHPLRRLVLAYVSGLALATIAIQIALGRPAIAGTLLVPFLILVTFLAADRSGFRRQQRELRAVLEATLTPIALPHERPPDAPFRRDRPA
ncbi:MAG TPA: hypothetical protein VIK91_17000 [Nannocystis sp.]